MQNMQQTLARACSFEGKGLHTGKIAHMTVHPGP
ncbi:MAG: UDP-3-O-acyl-N-acetylglucosamine deacetylase, partial [Bacteroidales bacterium]|nr:UDP-3-O-acyl-N-acetylglucosamine deacetylase [Bacteroidales bacterium]